jgi:ribose-phosphate pyrophosphokinase
MTWTEPPFLLGGSAHPALLRSVAETLHAPLRQVVSSVFPDGEMHVSLEQSVRGEHVFLLQPIGMPPERHLFELMLISDACWRVGVRELTALVPYFAYARQERRAHGREAVGARLVADLLAAAHVQRVVAVDAHAPALEGFFAVPFEHLTAFPLLLGALGDLPGERGVVVAPDFGAVKLARRFADALDLPMAVVHKTRLSGSAVEVTGISGDVRGRAPLIVDDMISTGGTIEAAARALLAADCSAPIAVVATHALFVGPATERLASLPLSRVIVTDSVPAQHPMPFEVQRVPLAPLLAQAIGAIALGQSLHTLIAKT